MQQVPPGPEFDRLRARFAADQAGFEQQLLDGPPFPVYGLLAPRLPDGVVGGYSACGDALDTVELCWGGEHSAAPWVSVRTVADPGVRQWGRAHLADALADVRDRHAPDDEDDEDDGAEPPRAVRRRTDLVVDGAPIPADVRVEAEYWVAVLDPAPSPDHPSVRPRVVVVSHRVPLDDVRLGRVPDLGPYVRGMAAAMARATESAVQQVRPRDLDLPPAQGFEAHRALVASCIAHGDQTRQAMPERRRPRRRSGRADGERYAREWEAAVRAQMHFAGQDRVAADAAVAALVNQVIQLGLHAGWFRDGEARHAAVEESIRWTVFDSDVPSRPAQEAWLAAWRAQQFPQAFRELRDDDPEAVRARLDARRGAQVDWLSEWTAWHHRRTGAAR